MDAGKIRTQPKRRIFYEMAFRCYICGSLSDFDYRL